MPGAANQSELWTYRLAVATAGALLLSIAAAQILMTATLLAWLVAGPRRVVRPGYLLPLAAFMAATLLSLALSPDPGVGFGPVRKFVLFAMGFMAATFITGETRCRRTGLALLTITAAGAALGLIQFGLQYREFLGTGRLADDPTVLARITGFMGHWMTFSGQQMLVLCAALPLAWYLGVRRYWLPLALIGAALLMSFTRNAWVGAAAGGVTAALYLPRPQLRRLLLPGAILVLLAALPIAHRVSMSFEAGFAPDAGRIAMIDVGLRMIADHPWFGVGPERVGVEFPDYYRGDNLESIYYGHLHNNFLQIGAERGLLCLAALIWFFARLGLDLRRRARSADPWVKWPAVSGLSVLAALVAAGMFEYNFGDSEVLMLFMFLVSIPYGMSAAAAPPAPPAAAAGLRQP